MRLRARVRRGRRLDRRDVGSLRQRRPDASVREWLARFPASVLGGDWRLLLVQAWVSALRGARGRHARRGAHACGSSAASTRGRCRTASRRSSRAWRCCARRSRWGDVVGDPRTRRALGGARGTGLAVAAGDHLGARLGALLRRRPRSGRALAARDDEIAPAIEQWIVGVAAIADLSLIAGMRGRRGEQLRLALEAVELRARARPAGRRRGRRGAYRLRRRAGGAGPSRGGAAGARAGRLPTPALGASRWT